MAERSTARLNAEPLFWPRNPIRDTPRQDAPRYDRVGHGMAGNTHRKERVRAGRGLSPDRLDPIPPDPQWPRYTSHPFPMYRFVPGVHPHPRRHPNGHSYGQPEPVPIALSREQWARSDAYLFGVDLYNFAFWWECHEVFEGFWRVAGPKTEQGRFFQALIQVAAANLKVCMGSPSAADRLVQSALGRLTSMPSTYMGIAIRAFEQDVLAYAQGAREKPALIKLQMPLDAPTSSPRDASLPARGRERLRCRATGKDYPTMDHKTFPRSPKITVGGMAHLGRLIDKIRLRHAGRIPDYNYLMVGFDKYLLDLLNLSGEELERRVLQGGTDEGIVQWVKDHARYLSEEDLQRWNDRIITSGPQDEAAHRRFQARLTDIAAKRGVAVNALPAVTTWADVIELDEGRL